jgi:hypothetical protein
MQDDEHHFRTTFSLTFGPLGQHGLVPGHRALKSASGRTWQRFRMPCGRPDVPAWANRRVTAWTINPTVHTKFAARAKGERERREAARQERFGRDAA